MMYGTNALVLPLDKALDVQQKVWEKKKINIVLVKNAEKI